MARGTRRRRWPPRSGCTPRAGARTRAARPPYARNGDDGRRSWRPGSLSGGLVRPGGELGQAPHVAQPEVLVEPGGGHPDLVQRPGPSRERHPAWVGAERERLLDRPLVASGGPVAARRGLQVLARTGAEPLAQLAVPGAPG